MDDTHTHTHTYTYLALPLLVIIQEVPLVALGGPLLIYRALRRVCGADGRGCDDRGGWG